MLNYEREMKIPGMVAGVDEAGRGPLAGPVVAGAVILPKDHSLDKLDDSKKLTPATREQLFSDIKIQAVSWGVGIVNEAVIDEINILQAALLAMKQAVNQLSKTPDRLLIDGNQRIDSSIRQETLVKGDSRSHSIAAASILAKVTRDRMMNAFHAQYPQYAFDRHKGYGTQLHLEKIREFGPCPIHRRTFKGVREFL